MPRVRVSFTLSMPNVGSWDGKWSGASKNYVVYESVDSGDLERLNIPGSFHYSWSDGWGATVTARLMGKGERRSKSDGFCGYEWMVRNILRWGTAKCQCEWVPYDPCDDSGRPWQRCKWCRRAFLDMLIETDVL